MGMTSFDKPLDHEIDALNSNMIQKSSLKTKAFDEAVSLTQNAWTQVISNLGMSGVPKLVNCYVHGGSYFYANLPVYLYNGKVGIYNNTGGAISASADSFVALLF